MIDYLQGQDAIVPAGIAPAGEEVAEATAGEAGLEFVFDGEVGGQVEDFPGGGEGECSWGEQPIRAVFVLGQFFLQGEEEFLLGQVQIFKSGVAGVFQIEAVAEGDIEAGGVDVVRVGVFDDARIEEAKNIEVGEEHLGVLVGGVAGAVVNDWLTTGSEVAQGEDGGDVRHGRSPAA